MTAPTPNPMSDRQRKLYRAVTAAASHINEQLLMLRVHAYRLGATEADVRAVRQLLAASHSREASR